MKYFSAYVDFSSDSPLADLASQLSERIFGGLSFVGLNEGLWDEVPAVRLEKDFLGLRIELGGVPGAEDGFTLQVEPFDFPWERVEDKGAVESTVDLTSYLRFLLEDVPGIVLRQVPSDR